MDKKACKIAYLEERKNSLKKLINYVDKGYSKC